MRSRARAGAYAVAMALMVSAQTFPSQLRTGDCFPSFSGRALSGRTVVIPSEPRGRRPGAGRSGSPANRCESH